MKLDASAFVADQSLISVLQAHSEPVPCEQDRILFSQGDAAIGAYIVTNGVVELTMHSEAGKIVMQIVAEHGSLLGLPGMIGNVAYSLSARAKKGAEVSFVSREKFNRLMMSEPETAMAILRVLAAEVRSARVAAVSAA